MGRSAAHAASHPRYAFPGYRCDCGVYSRTSAGHFAHVRAMHADDEMLCARNLPLKQYRRLFKDDG